jgi:hypothetical protein
MKKKMNSATTNGARGGMRSEPLGSIDVEKTSPRHGRHAAIDQPLENPRPPQSQPSGQQACSESVARASVAADDAVCLRKMTAAAFVIRR